MTTPISRPERILIANRGEIALRIARAADELGIQPITMYSEDDANARHRIEINTSVPLAGEGPAAYLDIEQIIQIAKEQQCLAIHPGYGFLSESPAFAQRCAEEGIRFIGPEAKTIELLGNKDQSRQFAQDLSIPVIPGTAGAVTLEECITFYKGLPTGAAMVIKAVSGGGGRGMRVVTSTKELAASFDRCQSEALRAFGNEAVYAELYLENMRHIEIQVAGDGSGEIRSIGERDCSIQRRHQKIMEIAPAPFLDPELKSQLFEAAEKIASALNYRALGTIEFLVSTAPKDNRFYFMEANPRLQVEHTITEEIYGIDLVQSQILLGLGATLDQSELPASLTPRGMAIQLRVNLEEMQQDGSAKPTRGTLQQFDLPGGPGIRVDTCGYTGLTPSNAFDALIAKLIVYHPSGDIKKTLERAKSALNQFHIKGVKNNLGLLYALVNQADLCHSAATTQYYAEHTATLLANAKQWQEDQSHTNLAIDNAQDLSKTTNQSQTPQAILPPGLNGITTEIEGKLLKYLIEPGDNVIKGMPVAIIESMKMEHEVLAQESGYVDSLFAEPGDLIEDGATIIALQPADTEHAVQAAQETVDIAHIRPDLAELLERRAWTLDKNRPEAVERRKQRGKHTARQNIDLLFDSNSFLEYGSLVVAGQRNRRPIEELRKISPADGFISGTGTINAEHFGIEHSRAMAMTYDYTVFAGTQGHMAHQKSARLLELAERLRLPLVLFAEGGGGRPGDTDKIGGANPSNPTFWRFARLSGLVPLVGIVSGRCFAGNAVLLGACDIIIATEDSSIGMAGPIMIEYAGLGNYTPEEVGPISFQAPNGVVDVVVKDEQDGIDVAKKYLAFFQGRLNNWESNDQRELRHIIPENRLRAYDVREIIDVLMDKDSVLELRKKFGLGAVTAFGRIEGRPIGIIANNPQHLAGAIDADESDKIARFMQLCDAFNIPLLSLIDTPGFMVGPTAEKRALVRHTSRIFVTGASLDIPVFVVVLRKGYGLGAMAMGGGAFQPAAISAVSWPTGEFGAMGLEGAVQLAYRKELAAIESEDERQAEYQRLVDEMYEHGKAVNIGPFFAFDEVIDPADTRQWIKRGLELLPASPEPTKKRRPNIDPW